MSDTDERDPLLPYPGYQASAFSSRLRARREAAMSQDLAWGTVTPRKCRRHEWVVFVSTQDSIAPGLPATYTACQRCHQRKDPTASLRGKRNRSRGNAIEREVAKQLGLRRVGQYGGPEDIGDHTSPFLVQVKSGKSFPERLYRWLKALPSNANQTPIVVVTDAPGPGRRRRALVVLTLEDWVALHGPVGEEAA
jgi:hypothetical protein